MVVVWRRGFRAVGAKAFKYRYSLILAVIITVLFIRFSGVRDVRAVQISNDRILDIPGKFQPTSHTNSDSDKAETAASVNSGPKSGLGVAKGGGPLSNGLEESYRHPIQGETPSHSIDEPGLGSHTADSNTVENSVKSGFKTGGGVGLEEGFKGTHAGSHTGGSNTVDNSVKSGFKTGDGLEDGFKGTHAGSHTGDSHTVDNSVMPKLPEIANNGSPGLVRPPARLPGDTGSYQYESDDGWSKRELEIITSGGGHARMNHAYLENTLLPPVSLPRIEKFPVARVIKLPVGDKKLPQVQAERFLKRTAEEEAERKRRLDAVKEVMQISWKQYKQYAWGADELKPKTSRGFSPFLGWAATIVDALDTLKIMGMQHEFEEAIAYVETIDFSRSFRFDLPVFETTIRYLGGLLAAHDLCDENEASSKKVLLKQAKLLGDNLIGAFDTPNRMPLTFFDWTEMGSKFKYRAGQDAAFSEVTSLSVEFTRLAQLTKEDKYYDAIARITNAVYEFGPKSDLPWLFPQTVDISGCKVNIFTNLQPPRQDTSAQAIQPSPLRQSVSLKSADDVRVDRRSVINSEIEDKGSHRVLIEDPRRYGNVYTRGYCEPKRAMERGAHAGNYAKYGMGSRIDSGYEYYMKMHMLLKGAEPKYVELYEGMVESAMKYLIFKPRVENNDKILFAGVQVGQYNGEFVFDGEMTHLTCFVGGMFALGGKLLSRPQDVQLGAKLTEGCVWAYNRTRTGIMPESFTVRKCPDLKSKCVFEPYIGSRPEAIHDNNSASMHARDRRAVFDASSPQISLVSDGRGGERWPLHDSYDQPLSFIKQDPRYLLRPEALESVFYMWRISGDKSWQDKGWQMFNSIRHATALRAGDGTIVGYSAIDDVTDDRELSSLHADSAESFWMAETLKYAYLLFADTDTLSLDEYVLNTEAHPFRRP